MERVNERLGKVDDGKSYTDSRILVQSHKINNIFFHLGLASMPCKSSASMTVRSYETDQSILIDDLHYRLISDPS